MSATDGPALLARRGPLLAWSAWAITVILTPAPLYLSQLNGVRSAFGVDLFVNLYIVMALLAFPTAGAVIASRRPRNPVGWLYLMVMPLVVLAIGSSEYAIYALAVRPGELPLGRLALWVSIWAWIPALGLVFMVIPLLLPNGRLPSPAWRPFLWLLLVAGAAYTLMNMLAPITIDNPGLPRSANPFGLEALGPALGAVLNLGDFLMMVLAMICAFSLVARYRKAGHSERRQVKWIGVAVVFVIASLAPLTIMQAAAPATRHLVVPAFALAVMLIPMATAIAVLDPRHVDIERIIRGALLVLIPGAALAAVYAGLAAALRPLLSPGSASLAFLLPVPVLVTLFSPLQRATAALVDRRTGQLKEDRREPERPHTEVIVLSQGHGAVPHEATPPDRDHIEAESHGEKAA